MTSEKELVTIEKLIAEANKKTPDKEKLWSILQSLETRALNPDAESILNDVAYELYVGWMAYYKGRNGRDEKTLLERLRKAKEILEAVDMWPPRLS